jgi:hypothetical protein
LAVAGAGGVEQKAWSLDGVAGDDDDAGTLEMLFPFAVEVEDAFDAAVVAERDARGHGIGPDFCAMRDGVGYMSDESAGLGADLAALDAEAAIDAVRAVSMGCGEDRDGSTGDGADAETGAAADEDVADSSHGMRAVGMAVRVSPGKPGGAGDGHLKFKKLVVRFEVPVGDGPVDADAVGGVDVEVRWMKARREGGPVDGASADAFAGVVVAEGEGMLAAGDAQIVPVELVRAALVADPIALGVPEGTGLEADNLEAGAGEPL